MNKVAVSRELAAIARELTRVGFDSESERTYAARAITEAVNNAVNHVYGLSPESGRGNPAWRLKEAVGDIRRAVGYSGDVISNDMKAKLMRYAAQIEALVESYSNLGMEADKWGSVLNRTLELLGRDYEAQGVDFYRKS